MKLSALVLLFAASCALARPEPRARPDCAKPCWNKEEIKAPCDPNQKTCYCARGSEVPALVGYCILENCEKDPEELNLALVDASETCRDEGH
ncbi:uncharacterized protein SCHCODRAFT_01323542 [Schizophyllum commune H4-8]|nr:uncharacterized protein SCHCODRAFT_01323542 [Schizophyllum commune H4-8]KAI5889195.1 hypothetical protein SCHCODRAFT_01323542 [Schizophyllum commune H4-8]